MKRITLARALQAETTHHYDYIGPYVARLGERDRHGSHSQVWPQDRRRPAGRRSIGYWDPIAERYQLNIEVVNRRVDPTFAFMTVDKDGKIRMDCSSPDAMASLIGHKDRFDIAFGNDPDADRHGIVTKSAGLMDPTIIWPWRSGISSNIVLAGPLTPR